MKKSKTSQKNDPLIAPSDMERFIELQKNEFMLRKEELALHNKKEENQKKIAEKAIAANLKDRESERW